MKIHAALSAMILGALCSIASAEITDRGPGGFTLVHAVTVDATRDEAWIAAVEHVAEWWNADHTISGDAALLSIEQRPLGCFCEATGGGVVHLTVTSVSAGVMLRMSGGLGPLGLMGVNGNMTWEFYDVEGGTKIRFFYAVGGYAPDGVDELAEPVDYVVGDALQRLKAFIDGQ